VDIGDWGVDGKGVELEARKEKEVGKKDKI
jgi:hypothetical protein